MSFRTARLAEFNAMKDADMYGDSFTFEGDTYECIVTPFDKSKEMKLCNYEEHIPAEITITADDFDASGLILKSVITAGENSFEITSIQLDNQEPTVVLRAVRKQ